MTTRRELFRIMLGLFFIPLAGGFLSMLPGRRVVRPPGAVDEKLFLELCARCGICVEACSSAGRGTLETCGLLDGVSIMGTPKVNPLRAPCEARYGICEGKPPCVKSCPTGALRWIEPEEIKLGSVSWSPDRCITVLGGECLVCAEVCPAPGAITPRNGIPVFHNEKCVGCGRCVYSCPADPKALSLTQEGRGDIVGVKQASQDKPDNGHGGHSRLRDLEFIRRGLGRILLTIPRQYPPHLPAGLSPAPQPR